ncbi:hypothetical protein [Martelella sp. AD-3]|uniref:hypothetical protein n=1 Tax=Martelella sp. AD-3 TaxID=686597 RepID=UPI001268118B|nr:hypothetical protein [Martelella sp. AD-3]
MSMKEIRGLSWWLFWRFTLSSLVGGYAASWVGGFVVGFAMALFGFNQDQIVTVTTALGWVIGLLFSFVCLNFFLARAVGRSFGGKTLNLSGSDQTAIGGM